MSRSFPLTVDRLEDRCVPAADALTQTEVIVAPSTTTESTEPVLAPAPAPSYVIDPYLIDPNAQALPPKPADQTPIPDSYWQSGPAPQSPVPPISDPFWY